MTLSDAPRGPRWPALLAWLVILGLVAFVVHRNAAPAPAADDEDAGFDDIRTRVTAQELIGLKRVGSLAGPAQAAQVSKSQEAVLLQLEQAAHSPEDHLHVAILTAELSGKDKALAELDALESGQPSPELARDIAVLRRIYSSKGSALEPEARNRLMRRHGYFARVALAYGVSSNAEPRKSLESGALRSTVILGFVGLTILMVIVAALGFFATAIVLNARGRIVRMYVPEPAASTAYLEGFAIYFSLFVLGLGLLRQHFGWASLQWEWLAWLILPIVMLWLTVRGIPFEDQRRALGWHNGKGVLREIGAGLAGYLAGVVIIVVGFLCTYLLMRASGTTPEHPIVHMLEGNRWHIIGLYALVSVFAPVMEETMFRGALFHHLRRRWRWPISASIVAFIFAVIHPQGWVAVPVLGSIALVLAAIREWRGSLIAPMVAHGFNNFLALTLALAVLR